MRNFHLEKAFLSSDDNTAGLGGTLITNAQTTRLNIFGGWMDVNGHTSGRSGTLYIVVNGKLVKEVLISGASFAINEEVRLRESGTQYVRFYMRISDGNLIANPIFIEKSE